MTTGNADAERIAFHEAGHVAARRHFERAIFLERGYVLINAVGGYGRTGLGSANLWWGGPSEPPVIDHPSIVAAMAGRAAEAIRYPTKRAELVLLSAASDEPLARCYIRALYGRDLSDSDITDRIRGAEAEASEILRGVWAGVEALAETLLARLKTEADEEAELTGAEALHVMDTALRCVSP